MYQSELWRVETGYRVKDLPKEWELAYYERWQTGYVSRVNYCKDKQKVYFVPSGKRYGQLYYLAPAYTSTQFCIRVYIGYTLEDLRIAKSEKSKTYHVKKRFRKIRNEKDELVYRDKPVYDVYKKDYPHQWIDTFETQRGLMQHARLRGWNLIFDKDVVYD